MIWKNLFNQLTNRPCFYDLIQNLAGARKMHRFLQSQVQPWKESRSVLDVGGGTGLYRTIWGKSQLYVCLDIDPEKLSAFGKDNSGRVPVVSNASNMAIKNESADIIMVTFVAHHLNDENLDKVFSESFRVLKKSGLLIFMDALWNPSSPVGCFLWKLDRGRYPRTYERLYELVSTYFQILRDEGYAIYHEYRLLIGFKNI